MTKSKGPTGLIVQNVDLDVDVVLDDQGRRLTEADMEARIVEAQELFADKPRSERIPGRPSLTGAGQHSPQVAVRLPADLNRRLGNRAKAEGKRVSDIVREAIEHYV